MLFAKFATICTATNYSLEIINRFFDNLDLLQINLCLVPDGCRLTPHATAHVSSPNTWISIISKTSWIRLIFLGMFTIGGSFFSHF